MQPLAGTRVLDLTGEIAGPYATKVLVDAGADVVKIEDGDGDPSRRWGSGALHAYLNAGKRSVTPNSELFAGAEIVVSDGNVDVEALRSSYPALVVVTITPFGLAGPYANRPATEFTLQALAGSIGQRGVPEEPPLAAGGRIGEWAAGTYAALAAIAALREARRSGHGEHVDIALLDCMVTTMVTYPNLAASMSSAPRAAGTGRSIEVPSIAETSDGYVVFTTNSAQQLSDFLLLVGRPDLQEDPGLARAAGRFARREEFDRLVLDYTKTRTTAQVLQEAAELRIPCGPVLNGSTVANVDHLVATRVFQADAQDRFLQPRRPYQVDGELGPMPGAVAAVGGDSGDVDWATLATTSVASWQRPLRGLRVLDLTAWWAGPVAPQALAALGADVIKVESTTRPDLMRYSSSKSPTEDRWYEWSWMFHGANLGKRGITLNLNDPEGVSILERLAATADVIVENYTPRVMDQFGLGWERLHQVNPRLIMVRMPAFGLTGPWRDRTGFAQTMESISGMAWLTGRPDGRPVLIRGACDPLAGMHAVIATLVALAQRDLDGRGHLVENIMVEAALNIAAEQVVEYTAAGELLTRQGNRSRDAAPQGVYPCVGDDQWLALTVATDTQWASLVEAMNSPAWACRPEYATVAGRRTAHDELDAGIAQWTSSGDAATLADLLATLHVAAAPVIAPPDVAANPQLRFRRSFQVEEHPVTGRNEALAFPVTFSRVEAWFDRPAPTLGEHNTEILTELGLAAAIPELQARGVIGDRVVGA